MRNKTYGLPYCDSSDFSIAVKLFIDDLYHQTVELAQREEKIPSERLLAQSFIISKPYIMINPLHNWWLNVYTASKFFYDIPSQNTFAFSENLCHHILD